VPNRCIARRAHGFPHGHLLARRRIGRRGHPRDVRVGANPAICATRLACPHIDQHQIAGLDRRRVYFGWRIVRIASVRTHRHNRRVIVFEPVVQHELREL
jgi:hypothetical protein